MIVGVGDGMTGKMTEAGGGVGQRIPHKEQMSRLTAEMNELIVRF